MRSAVTVESVKAYREAMAEFAGDAHVGRLVRPHVRAATSRRRCRPFQEEASTVRPPGSKTRTRARARQEASARRRRTGNAEDDAEVAKAIKVANKTLRKAHTRDSLHALARFAEVVDGRYRIVSQPPVVVPLRELDGAWGLSTDQIRERGRGSVPRLPDQPQRGPPASCWRGSRIVDMARKVVGVGSVGTRAFMVLLEGRDTDDPLFLQVKEATRSVLEDHLPKSRFHTPGQRVVEGQRLMQAASDIFLGWTKGVQDDRFYYWRQLRDMKASAVVETMTPFGMTFYARMCGWTLARAHARSGDPVAIAAYLGAGDDLDQAIAEFSAGYADQNSRDYEAFVKAVEGRPDRRRRRSLRPPWILCGASRRRGLAGTAHPAARSDDRHRRRGGVGGRARPSGVRRASWARCFSRSCCRSPFSRCAGCPVRHGLPAWLGTVLSLVAVYAMVVGLVVILVISGMQLAGLLDDYAPQFQASVQSLGDTAASRRRQPELSSRPSRPPSTRES